MNRYYKDYSEYLSEFFPGIKVQKLSINAGFSCPNRDGTIGKGGCIYCDNTTFTPSYCFAHDSVTQQIEAGKRFFSRKYPAMKYLAYFQSFTNTFISDTSSGSTLEERDREIRKASVKRLESLYREALGCKDVLGLVIGSRPDCFSDEVIELLADLNREYKVFVEIGAETSHNSTLHLINRGHTWEQTVDTVNRLASRGLEVGLHLICGLPSESEEMILETVRRVIELPIGSLKFHHLQIIESTELHKGYLSGKYDVTPYSMEAYLSLCERIIKIVPREIEIERFLA
ncbi:MAG: radical SAM protein, partial [Muribaculaceae bacterium]|nr:radical SAM protein [Muribaculaceae bacterium]